MGIELVEIEVQIKKFVVCSLKTCYRCVHEHPLLVGLLFFLIFMCRFFPFVFSLLVSASPVLISTAVLLGTLLSLGQPEIEKEEKTTHDIVSLRTGVPRDDIVVVDNAIEETSLVSNNISEVDKDDNLVDSDKDEMCDKGFELVSELDGDCVNENQHNRDEENVNSQKGSTDSRMVETEVCEKGFEQNSELNEDIITDGEFNENQLGSDNLDEENEYFHKGSIDFVMAKRELCDEGFEQNCELNEDKLLDGEFNKNQYVLIPQFGNDDLDMGNDNSPQCSIDSRIADLLSFNGEGDEQSEANGTDEEFAVRYDEEERGKNGNKPFELERNKRLENLIDRRRARKNVRIMAEKNLIDLESDDFSFNITPIYATRRNPFDFSFPFNDNIPMSAPSILLPRQNHFDLPYESSEEIHNSTRDALQHESVTFQSKEFSYRRHESFNAGPSFFEAYRTETSYSSFQRHSNEKVIEHGDAMEVKLRDMENKQETESSFFKSENVANHVVNANEVHLFGQKYSSGSSTSSSLEETEKVYSIKEDEELSSSDISEMGSSPILLNRTVSFAERESEMSNLSIGNDTPGNEEKLVDSSDEKNELGSGEVTQLSENDVTGFGLTRFDQDSDSAVASIMPESVVATEDQSLAVQNVVEQISLTHRNDSSFDTESIEDHLMDKEVNFDVGIDQEADHAEENILSQLEEELPLCNKWVDDPSSENSEDLQEPLIIQTESIDKESTTHNLNVSEIQDSTPIPHDITEIKSPSVLADAKDTLDEVENSDSASASILHEPIEAHQSGDEKVEFTDSDFGFETTENQNLAVQNEEHVLVIEKNSVTEPSTYSFETESVEDHLRDKEVIFDVRFEQDADEKLVEKIMSESENKLPFCDKSMDEPSSENSQELQEQLIFEMESIDKVSTTYNLNVSAPLVLADPKDTFNEIENSDNENAPIMLEPVVRHMYVGAHRDETDTTIQFEPTEDQKLATLNEQHPSIIDNFENESVEGHLMDKEVKFDVGNDQESDKNCVSEEKILFQSEEKLPLCDKSVDETSSENLEELQMGSVRVNTNHNLNVSEVQELDNEVSPPCLADVKDTLDQILVTESTESHVDTQNNVDDIDGIEEIDEGLLLELDAVGDFSIEDGIGMLVLEARSLEDIDSAFKKIEKDEIEKPIVEEHFRGNEVNFDVGIGQESDEKLVATYQHCVAQEKVFSQSEEELTLCDKSIDEPSSENPEESQMESIDKVNTTHNLNVSEVQELDNKVAPPCLEDIQVNLNEVENGDRVLVTEAIDSPMGPTDSLADTQNDVEYADGMEEIDEGLLLELDAIGDFSIKDDIGMRVVEAKSLEDIDSAFKKIGEEEIEKPIVVESIHGEPISEETGCNEVNFGVGIGQESDEKLVSTDHHCVSQENVLSEEEEELTLCDKSIHEPSSKNPEESQMESIDKESTTHNLNVSEVQELDNKVTPLCLEDIQVSLDEDENCDRILVEKSTHYPAGTTDTHADTQNAVEDEDELTGIDEGLLSDLDAVGDFNIKDSGSNSNETGMRVVEAKSLEDIDLAFKQINEDEIENPIFEPKETAKNNAINDDFDLGESREAEEYEAHNAGSFENIESGLQETSTSAAEKPKQEVKTSEDLSLSISDVKGEKKKSHKSSSSLSSSSSSGSSDSDRE